MSLEQALAFYLFAVVAAVTPGPSNVMLTATGAQAGVVRGLPCLLGVAAGMGLLIFGVAMGFAGLVIGHPIVLRALNLVGAGFLIWLAYKIATAPAGGEAATEQKPVGFGEAALFQWVNPKSWLVGASAAGAYLKTDAGALVQALSFAALFVAAALPSGFLWLVFGAAMQRLLKSPAAWRGFNIAMGVALALSIALILL